MEQEREQQDDAERSVPPAPSGPPAEVSARAGAEGDDAGRRCIICMGPVSTGVYVRSRGRLYCPKCYEDLRGRVEDPVGPEPIDVAAIADAIGPGDPTPLWQETQARLSVARRPPLKCALAYLRAYLGSIFAVVPLLPEGVTPRSGGTWQLAAAGAGLLAIAVAGALFGRMFALRENAAKA